MRPSKAAKEVSSDSATIFGRRAGILVWVFAVAGLMVGTSWHNARAQAVYGSIFGTITDSTGAVIPNATVTVIIGCRHLPGATAASRTRGREHDFE
jgi:hypothetical protein